MTPHAPNTALRRSWAGLAALAFALTLGVAAHLPGFANPDSLWNFVKLCRAEAVPKAGCVYHDRAQKFVVIKDSSPWKRAAYLLIPTDRVHGIESPLIFSAPVVDFWQDGWAQARRLIGLPPQGLGLAINSVVGRSQNQLHIHLACAKPATLRALAAAPVTSRWGATPFVRIDGRTYNALETASLAGANSPFRLAAELPGARSNMRLQTLAVFGAPGSRFYVVEDSAHGSDPGVAEELLDQACASSNGRRTSAPGN